MAFFERTQFKSAIRYVARATPAKNCALPSGSTLARTILVTTCVAVRRGIAVLPRALDEGCLHDGTVADLHSVDCQARNCSQSCRFRGKSSSACHQTTLSRTGERFGRWGGGQVTPGPLDWTRSSGSAGVLAAGPPRPVSRKPCMALRSGNRATAARLSPCYTSNEAVPLMASAVKG